MQAKNNVDTYSSDHSDCFHPAFIHRPNQWVQIFISMIVNVGIIIRDTANLLPAYMTVGPAGTVLHPVSAHTSRLGFRGRSLGTNQLSSFHGWARKPEISSHSCILGKILNTIFCPNCIMSAGANHVCQTFYPGILLRWSYGTTKPWNIETWNHRL